MQNFTSISQSMYEKSVYFEYSMFQKGINSFNNWRKDTQTWSVVHETKLYASFQLNLSKHVQ